MHEQSTTSTTPSAQTSLPKPAAITESEEEGEVVSGQSASPGPSLSSSSSRPSEAVQAAVASAVASVNITQPQTISTTSDTSPKTTTTTTTTDNDDNNKKPSTLENEPVQPPAAETMSEAETNKSENNDTNALEEGEIDE